MSAKVELDRSRMESKENVLIIRETCFEVRTAQNTV